MPKGLGRGCASCAPGPVGICAYASVSTAHSNTPEQGPRMCSTGQQSSVRVRGLHTRIVQSGSRQQQFRCVRSRIAAVVLSFLLRPPILTSPASSRCWPVAPMTVPISLRAPISVRGGGTGQAGVEIVQRGHATERCKTADLGMARALGESWTQLDPIVSEYICSVLADAAEGEERDSASFLPSISSLLDGVSLLPVRPPLSLSSISITPLSFPAIHPLYTHSP